MDTATEHPDAATASPASQTEYAAKLARVVATVSTWLASLIDPDQVVELRALKMHDGRGGHTVAGVFRGNELSAMANAALTLSGNCQGVYYTMNPLAPDRFVVQAPRMRRADHGELASDKHVVTRRWLLIDVDPVRAVGASKESATDGEKAAAWETLQRVKEYLTVSEAWAAPVVSDSGNGYHLLFKLGEPATGVPVESLPTPDGDVLRRVLQHLADRFDTAHAKIDQVTFNPARIVKFPGALACKGTPTAERPHRRAKVLEVPAVEMTAAERFADL
jgi:hypothetical protein